MPKSVQLHASTLLSNLGRVMYVCCLLNLPLVLPSSVQMLSLGSGLSCCPNVLCDWVVIHWVMLSVSRGILLGLLVSGVCPFMFLTYPWGVVPWRFDILWEGVVLPNISFSGCVLIALLHEYMVITCNNGCWTRQPLGPFPTKSCVPSPIVIQVLVPCSSFSMLLHWSTSDLSERCVPY